MHICVGSYADMAVKKVCSIYVLRELSSNKPVGCIELRDDCVVQAKDPYNRPLHDIHAAFINEWIEENKLHCKTDDINRLAG